MPTQPMILSWCPGDPCDPCKPKPVHHMFIVGSIYASPADNPLVYISYYNSGPPDYAAPISLSGTLMISAVSPTSTQKYQLLVQVTGYAASGSNAFGMPLPATDTGIVVDASTRVTMSETGNVIISGPLAPSLYYVDTAGNPVRL